MLCCWLEDGETKNHGIQVPLEAGKLKDIDSLTIKAFQNKGPLLPFCTVDLPRVLVFDQLNQIP